MLKVSLGIAVLALVSLFVGLFVVTDTLTFMFAAIALTVLAMVALVVGVVIQLIQRQ